MKNFILASSLAVLAAGSATPAIKSVPAKSNAKTMRKMIDAERSSIRKTSKADSKAAKASVVAAKAVAKEEGVVFTDSHSYSDFFEITQGSTDCTSPSSVGRVEGFEAYRCLDFVIDNGDGTAFTESEILVKPQNYGFPIVYFFDGHGCREENMYGHWRMHKTDFGFDRHYTGGCMPVFESPSDTVPMFFQQAQWEYMRYEPMYPSVMQGIDGKHKGCSRNKYDMYGIMAAYTCTPTGDGDTTTPEWSYFDIANCTMGSVEEKFFSDPFCSTTMTHSEVHYKEDCVFDFHEFQMYLAEYGLAAFEYRTRDCTWGASI